MLLLLFVNSVVSAQVNVYVDGQANGSNNGTSWQNAYTDLDEALKRANEGTGAYDIHVASGTYYPGTKALLGAPDPSSEVHEGSDPSWHETADGGAELIFAVFALDYLTGGEEGLEESVLGGEDKVESLLEARDETFVIKRGGIRLLGGYPTGGGTRNISSNTTILSGDLGTQNDKSDNAYHVIAIASDGYTFINDSTVIDGFEIRDGHANGDKKTPIGKWGFVGGKGGGISMVFHQEIYSTPKIQIRNCRFTNNFAHQGASVIVEGGGPTFSNCTFDDNDASVIAGGIYNVYANSVIENCTFTGNTSKYYGGAVMNGGIAGMNVKVDNCEFKNNVADYAGGALFTQINVGGSTSITNSLFDNNSTSNFGGGATVIFGSANFENCEMKNNSAKQGGAINFQETQSVDVKGTTFSNNSATDLGGAVAQYDRSVVDYTSCTFLNNNCDINGGALALQIESSAKIDQSVIKGNKALSGGGLYINEQSVVTLNSSTLDGNSTFVTDYATTKRINQDVGGTGISTNYTQGGGAYVLDRSDLGLKGCTIKNNTSLWTGGGLFIWGNSGANVENSIFSANVCENGGGGIMVNDAATLSSLNCFFDGNKALNAYGGAINNKGNTTVINALFYNNRGKQFGAAIDNNESFTITNSTFYGNDNNDGQNEYFPISISGKGGKTITINNSIVWDGITSIRLGTFVINNSNINDQNGVASGTGNILQNPEFVNPGDPDGPDNIWGTLDDGLKLKSNSPSKNTGNNSFIGTISKDIMGLARTEGGTIDMGAYENFDVTPANVLTFAVGANRIALPHVEVPSQFTVEFRYKSTATQRNPVFHWTSNSNQNVIVEVDGGKPKVGINGAYALSSSVSVNDGNWHLVSVSYDGSELSVYVNGTKTGSSALVGASFSTSKLALGAIDGGQQVGGSYLLDEVKLWSRSLCGGELDTYKSCEFTSAQTGLLSYYQFNQGIAAAANNSIVSLVDASGNNNTGTLVGFDLAGNSNWIQSNSGVSGTCGSFATPSLTISSNSPINQGASLEFTASSGFTTYLWTGPNLFSSGSQNPTIANAAANASGKYMLTASNNGCTVIDSLETVVNSSSANAIAFDGADKINFPHFQLGGEYTVEVKIKTNKIDSQRLITWFRSANGLPVENSFGIGDGEFYSYQVTINAESNNDRLDGATEVTDGNWHHVAFVKRDEPGQNCSVFVDGVEVGKLSVPFTPQTEIAYVGNQFDGTMDELRVWSRALCANEIDHNKNFEISSTSNGLELYYQFNQGSDRGNNTSITSVNDAAGNDNNGSFEGFNLNYSSNSNFVLDQSVGSVVTGAQNPVAYSPPVLSQVRGGLVSIVNGSNNVSGSDNTDFGAVDLNGTKLSEFTLVNSGNSNLTISSIMLVGDNANMFSLSNIPAFVEGNKTKTFSITYNAGSFPEFHLATVIINYAGCETGEFTFAIEGRTAESGPGAALNFDGIDDHLDVDYSNNGSYTVEAWVRTTSNGTMPIVTLWENGTQHNGLFLSGGYPNYFQFNGGLEQVQMQAYPNAINDGQWHHVAMAVYDGQYPVFYIDGVSHQGYTMNNVVATSKVYVGYTEMFDDFNGDIDEVKVWSRTLCADEIVAQKDCEVSPSSLGLEVYINLNEGLAGADNTNLSLQDEKGNNVGIHNFTKNGPTSNFILTGAVVSGTTCGPVSGAEIAVVNSNQVEIVNNDFTPETADFTDFGDVDVNAGPTNVTFTVKNLGTGILNISGNPKVVVTGAGFILAEDLNGQIAGSTSDDFTILFDPSALGQRTGTVKIYSDDCDESLYTFTIQGNGIGGEPTANTLDFDGIDDYLSVGQTSAIDLSANYTLECWVYLESTASMSGLISKDIVGNNHPYQLRIQPGGQVVSGIYENGGWSAVSSTFNLSTSQWYHIAASYDGAEMRLYINGDLDGQVSRVGSIPVVNSPLNIGRTNDVSYQYLNGKMDEVRLWNRTLCSEEIKNNMNSELSNASGLVAYYQLNQGLDQGANSGETTAVDATGNGLSAALNGFALSGTTSNWVASSPVTTGSIAPVYLPSDITVNAGGSEIVNGDNTPSINEGTDFGNVQPVYGVYTKKFAVANVGSGRLNLTGTPKVVVSGSGFSLLADLDSNSLGFQKADTFEISFTPTAAGLHQGTITILSSDCDEGSYVFTIQGTGVELVSASALDLTNSTDALVSDANVLHGNCTFEAYVYVSQSQVGDGIISQRNPSGFTEEATLMMGDNGRLRMYTSSGAIIKEVEGSTDIRGAWHHIAGVRDAEALILYVDGVEEELTILQMGNHGGWALAHPIVIGARYDYLSPSSIKIDEVKIWDRILCGAEIKAQMNCSRTGSEFGLEAYYKFNEGFIGGDNSTVLSTDYSVNANHLSKTNSSTSIVHVDDTPSSEDVCGAYSAPVVALTGDGITISNNGTPSTSNNTDFGFVEVGQSKSLDFVLSNTGSGVDLNLLNNPRIVVSGQGFTLTESVVESISAGNFDQFTIQYKPLVSSNDTGTVTIVTDACVNGEISFNILGVSEKGQSLAFESSNDEILVDMPATDISGAFTVEMWVKPASTTETAVLFETRTSTVNSFHIELGGNGLIHGLIGDGNNWLSTDADHTGPYAADTWMHIAYVINGDSYEIYRNGVLKTSGALSGSALLLGNGADAIRLGRDVSGSLGLNGQLDEVRVWSRALCAAEISNYYDAQLTVPQSGLVAYYSFNQGIVGQSNASIAVLEDVSGNGHNGTLTNFNDNSSNWLGDFGHQDGKVISSFIPASIEVRGNGVVIADNNSGYSVGDNTDFGSVVADFDSTVTHSFDIVNNGGEDLILQGSPFVTVSGADFTLAVDAASVIQSGQSSSFEVEMNPTIVGAVNASIQINSNACSNPDFLFNVKGEGSTPVPASALHFDGSNDYVTITDPYTDFGKNITVEWWANIETGTNESGIGQSTVGSGSLDDKVWLMRFGGGNSLYFEVNPANGSGDYEVVFFGTITPGWHHIVGVLDDNWIYAYIDGVLFEKRNRKYSGINNNASSEIQFGKDVRASTYMSGSIGEVRIWDRALSIQELDFNASCERTGVASGLVGYYQFNEGSANGLNTGEVTLPEISGQGGAGTLVNFGLSGTTSNWVSGQGPETGVTCEACVPFAETIDTVVCNSYTSPSGRYNWLTTGTYYDSLITATGCDSVYTVNLSVFTLSDSHMLTPLVASVCGPTETSITLDASGAGVSYQLLNATTMTAIGAPVIGTGSSILIPTGEITATIDYKVRADNGSCSIVLVNSAHIDFNALPNTAVYQIDYKLAASAEGVSYDWRDCSNFGSSIATTQVFEPAQSGSYSVILTDQNTGCVDTSSCKPITIEIRAGQALLFDGIDDYVELPVVPQSDFTLEFWMKTTTPGSTGTMWYRGSGLIDGEVPNGVNDYGTSLLGDKVAFGIGNPDITITSISDVTTGEWEHVAATWKRETGEMTLYINGVIEASGVSVGRALRNAPQRLTMGGLQTNIKFYQGQLDNARIWDQALTPAQIAARMHCENNEPITALLADYHFGQGDSLGYNRDMQFLTDHSYNNNHGLLRNLELAGNNSNFTAPGAVTSGAYCTSCVASSTGQASLYSNDPVFSPSGRYEWSETGVYNDTILSATGCDSMLVVNYANSQIVSTVSSQFGSLTSDVADAVYEWLSCATGDPVAGQVSQTLSGVETGMYSVVVTKSGQVDTSDCGMLTHLAGALHFDGINDYAVTANNVTHGDQFTYEVKLKLLEAEDWGGIMATSGPYNSSNDFVQLNTTSDGRLRVEISKNGQGSKIYDCQTVLLDVWHHVAITYDGASLKAFVDGVEESVYHHANSNVSGMSINAPLLLGSSRDLPSQLHSSCIMDEVRIWSKALTPTEINDQKECELSGIPSDLVAYYSFNQGVDQGENQAETTVTESTISDLDATTMNMALSGSSSNWVVSNNSTTTYCQSNPAATLHFDGVNDYLISSNVSGLPSGAVPFTASVWVNTAASTLQTMMDFAGVSVSSNASGDLVLKIGANDHVTSAAIADNAWHHVAVIRGATNEVNVLVDGTSVLTVTDASALSGSELRVGSTVSGTNYYEGLLDELRIWNKAVDVSDIAYKRSCELDNGTSGLVVYYKFNQGNDGSDNSLITQAVDASGRNNNALLQDFTLDGSTSNWLANGAVTSDVVCQPCFSDQAVSLDKSSICFNASIEVTLASSEVGIDYYLRNNANNEEVAGPVSGDGSGLFLINNDVQVNTTYHVYAVNGSTCSGKLSTLLTVSVAPQLKSSQTVSLCAGGSVDVGNNTYSTSGTYTDVFPTASGCDSIVTTNVVVLAPLNTTVTMDANTLTAAVNASYEYQWLDCGASHADILGETGISYEPGSTGEYAVEVAKGVCSDTSNCIEVVIVGSLAEFNPTQIDVFPNPTAGSFWVDLTSVNNPRMITVKSMSGAVVYQLEVSASKVVELDLDVPSGMYLIDIKSDDMTSVLKVMKEK